MLLSANSYILIIAGAIIIILSYFYNIIARKTNVPAVLMLIVTGMIIRFILESMGVHERDWFPTLEVLGIVGLIMIVLEAALELELTKEKWPIIWKSFLVALIALVLSTFAVAVVINFFILNDTFTSLLYAIPISIMSSAIIIPSVGSLPGNKKEFMVYESTFSDILGIMFFYFLVDNADATTAGSVLGQVVSNIVITIVLSVVLSYVLVWVFQRLKSQLKLFLLIAVLMLLYAVGKQFHLSSLVIILVFGLIINNHKLFFKGFLKPLVNVDALKPVLHDLHIVTLETAFVVRTFFFVIFGISISLASLINIYVAFVSAIIILGLYGARLLVLRLFKGKDILPELYIAPRGLITILLFFAIPAKYVSEKFDSGILLYSIIITSIVMTWAMIAFARENPTLAEEASMSEEDDVDVDALVVQPNAGADLQSADDDPHTGEGLGAPAPTVVGFVQKPFADTNEDTGDQSPDSEESEGNESPKE